jgi:hypothetical protein
VHSEVEAYESRDHILDVVDSLLSFLHRENPLEEISDGVRVIWVDEVRGEVSSDLLNSSHVDEFIKGVRASDLDHWTTPVDERDGDTLRMLITIYRKLSEGLAESETLTSGYGVHTQCSTPFYTEWDIAEYHLNSPELPEELVCAIDAGYTEVFGYFAIDDVLVVVGGRHRSKKTCLLVGQVNESDWRPVSRRNGGGLPIGVFRSVSTSWAVIYESSVVLSRWRRFLRLVERSGTFMKVRSQSDWPISRLEGKSCRFWRISMGRTWVLPNEPLIRFW